ncbi:PAS domain-containing protein [Methylobacterium sp. J-026]|nr:PAS domain-containing protein [Methylobacterium sp. J-026]MCJ2137490.1 PAS domain-containing protein [Methylobacterium sp. J-026]
MGALMRAHDWARTPLGPPETWPQSLRTALSFCLNTPILTTILWGADLRMLYNDAYIPSMADRHPAALGCPVAEVWGEAWEQVSEPFLQCMETGEGFSRTHVEIPMVRRGRQETTYWDFSAAPIRGEDGSIVGLLNQGLEITERVRAESRAESETQRHRKLFEQAPGFTAILTGPEHVFTFVNDAYIRLIGQRDLVGLSVRRALPDIAGQGFYELLDQVFTTGERFIAAGVPIQLQRSGAVAEKRFVDFVYEPISDENGCVSGIFVQGFDATDTHLAQQALRESEEFNRRVLASSTDCIKVLDLDGKLTFMSEGGQGVMEVSDFNAINGCPWPNFWQGQGNIEANAAIAAAKAGRSTNFQGPADTMAGTPRWWDVQVTPILDAGGRPEKILSVSRDITALRQAEDVLRAHNETLEQRVTERTTELMRAEEALRQSQKMEAVGQLTGGLAHDFNNLLAGISGSLELMQIRMQQGRLMDVDRYMMAAQGAAKRAAALTHRLLAFSRRQTLAPKPTDVNRLATGIHDLIQRTVGPGIPVEVVGATNCWPVLVDPPQLENALLNLCINARDAMPDGGAITIETANKWMDDRAARQHDIPEGQYLSVCVTDTGTGMPPEVVARVFEPFFTTKPIGEGTGLGLSMIYGFAQQSGGQVRIYSEVGQGSTVCLYLPRHYGEVEDETTVEGISSLPRSQQGETVLVVDDEPTVRMLITDILEDLGCAAIEAGDSATGLKVLQSDVRIDLLVTDVGLPGGMNGRQMADAARAHRPALKVLFITGYAENAILGNGTLPPGMAVLTKPFAMDIMTARIRSMIESSKGQAGSS